MRSSLNMLAIGLVALMLSACGGGGPSDQSGDTGDGLGQLDFDLTSSAGSAVNASAVTGQRVDLTHPNFISASDGIPSGSRAVYSVLLSPETGVGGFEGTLTVRPGRTSSALFGDGNGSVFHIDTEDGSARRCGSLREFADGSLHVADLSALGLLVFAEDTGASFAISAFADMSSAPAGSTVHFWALAPGGDPPVTFEWNFGDGASATGDSVSHLYALPGLYNVSVIGTDALGNVSPAASTPIEITATALPLTGVTVSGPTPVAGQVLTFTYGATAQGGMPPYTYLWDFDGDGTSDSSAGPPVDHHFLGNGFFEGSLTLTDALGDEATASFYTDCRRLDLDADRLSAPAPIAINFSLATFGVDVSDSLTVDFGDGATLANPGPAFSHVYLLGGSFDVVVTATRSAGGTTFTMPSNTVTVVISPPPPAPFLQLTQPIRGPSTGGGNVDFSAYGYNFGPEQGARRLLLDGAEIAPTSWSSNIVTFTLPQSTPMGQLTIDTPDSSSNFLNINAGTAGDFIQNVLPLDNSDSNRMLVIGAGFGAVQGTATCNGVPMNVLAWCDSAVLAETPAGLAGGLVDVVLSIPGQPFGLTFTTRITPGMPPGPTLTGLDQASQFGAGPAVTLTGTALGSADGGLAFCDGVVIPASSWSDTQITLDDPPVALDNWLVVLNREGVSNTLQFFDGLLPAITNVTPPDGYEGLSILIEGQRFGALQAGGVVTLNGLNLLVTAWSDGQITATLPMGVADGDLVVHRHFDSAPYTYNIIPRPPGKPDPGQI